ncbi:MAG: shikimate kinase [Nitrospirae bacterium]|nr:shikimate kinase [Nitrospirota bacterium]
MKNIVLIGFMGTGKTTAGKILAKELGMKLVDVDEEIESETGMTICDIFKEHGEPSFRDKETEMAKKISSGGGGLVISTGGGIVLREENIACLRQNGLIVCLMATPETILQRTKDSTDRPLLKVENPYEKIKELLNQRDVRYRNSDITIETDGKSPMMIAHEIIEHWKAVR